MVAPRVATSRTAVGFRPTAINVQASAKAVENIGEAYRVSREALAERCRLKLFA